MVGRQRWCHQGAQPRGAAQRARLGLGESWPGGGPTGVAALDGAEPRLESRAWSWASARTEENSGDAPRTLCDLTNRFLRENSQFFPKEMISVYRYRVKNWCLSSAEKG